MRTVEITEAPYDVSLEKTHSTITIRPPLTEAEWSEIEKAGDDILQRINGEKSKPLLVDLTPLDYMGSSMVAMIVRCWKSLNGNQQRFVVISNSDVVREVLVLSGLSKMWTIAPTREAGLKTLGIRTATTGAARSGTLLIGLGLLATLAALAGLGVWFASPAQRDLATGLIYGGAAGGFLLGLAIMLVMPSRQKFVGLGLVLLSAGVSVFRLMQS